MAGSRDSQLLRLDHLLTAVAWRLVFCALGLGHGQVHSAHAAAIVHRHLDDVIGIGIGRRRRGQQPDGPDRDTEDCESDRNRDQDRRHETQAPMRSMIVALAMPPPSHIVWSP